MKGYYRKRGNTWEYSVDLGRDSNGKRKRKSKSGFKTKKAAQAAANELMLQHNRGELTELSSIKFNDYLDEWMENWVKRNVRASTMDTRRYLIDSHLRPHFKGKELSKLKPKDFNELYTKKLEEGYSTHTIKQVHTILHKAFQVAVEWEYVAKNPLSVVSPPRLESKEIQTWTMEQANYFLNRTKDEDMHVAYVLAVYTGMRKGEILALRWKDVDMVNNRIAVTQTLVNTRNGLEFQEPKTKGSKRTISITDYVVTELKRRKRKIAENKMLLGTGYTDNDLVVCTGLGTPMSPRNMLRHFSRMIEKHNVPKIRFHDLRHTHATILLQLGEHPKIVSERLGHSRVGTTLDTYSHVMPDMQRETASKFEQAMRNTLGE